MDGDFKGDFTRDSYDPFKHYSRVLIQQGCVQFDADWNEQIDILLHHLRTLVKDLIGPHGGPGNSFKITDVTQGDFSIQPGHYYVDGILVENDDVGRNGEPIVYTYQSQPYSPHQALPAREGSYLIYLDVWERHVTYFEDKGIRDVALGENESATAIRAQIAWQVRFSNAASADSRFMDTLQRIIERKNVDDIRYITLQLAKRLQPTNRGQLQARANESPGEDTYPSITPPDAPYRGVENQLYRVEIHRAGTATGGATFKWSRENGSVVFPVYAVNEGMIFTLGNQLRNHRFTLKKDDWVEIVDNSNVLESPNSLLKVESVDYISQKVLLRGTPPSTIGDNPLLRRWDQQAVGKSDHAITLDNTGTAMIREGKWLTLEDGIQIWFQPGDSKNPATYRPGDYWLIPARTTTGNVEWPRKNNEPMPLSPHGVEHHYAPLALITLGGDNDIQVKNITDLRYKFKLFVELSK
jgi:hypothetical protein